MPAKQDRIGPNSPMGADLVPGGALFGSGRHGQEKYTSLTPTCCCLGGAIGGLVGGYVGLFMRPTGHSRSMMARRVRSERSEKDIVGAVAQ
jgi:hypothetical protein